MSGSTRGRGSDQSSDASSRREFLGASGRLAGVAAFGLISADLPAAENAAAAKEEDLTTEEDSRTDLGPIPKKTLGRTGEKVSILGLGTSGMGQGPQSVEDCVAVFSEAIDRGINYVDTARVYKKAEIALGRVLKTRRDRVFLVTKCLCDTRAEAEKSFEKSLRDLGVDHVDLLHCHSTGDRDVDVVLKSGGMWDYFLEQKKAGKTRFLGITGHSRPERFLRMLATDQVDVMMVAMNFVDRHIYGFEEKVLPVARERGTGVMAMKVFGGLRGGFTGSSRRRPSQMDPIYMQIAVRYAKSLDGVTGLVIGMQDRDEVRQNIRYVLNAPALSDKERDALEKHGKRIANAWGPRFGPVSEGD